MNYESIYFKCMLKVMLEKSDLLTRVNAATINYVIKSGNLTCQ